MKLTLIFTGKTEESYLKEGIEKYIKRLKRYIPCEIKILGGRGKKSGYSGGKLKLRDTDKLVSAHGGSSFVVLLDEKGEKFSSEGFAKFMEKTMTRGYKDIVFVTGDAYGFHDKMYSMANQIISLSDMTFSHQMVRLILAEQLYRAMTIIRGEPYHHETPVIQRRTNKDI